MKPLLVGEDNPHSADPRHALYPYPEHCAGGRLCIRVMGLRPAEYLRAFDRVNLCAGKWRTAEARDRARELICYGRVLVLLGAKVAGAFSIAKPEPFTHGPFANALWRLEGTVVQLPHPSGRCRAWNEPGAFERARACLREAGVLPLPSRPHTPEKTP